MRILHVLDHSLPLHSGYAFRSQSILRAQSHLGYHLAAVTSPKHQESWKGAWDAQEIVEGLCYFRTPLRKGPSAQGLYEIAILNALARRIQEATSGERPDLIHAHSPILNAIPALRVGKRLGIPVVYEIRAFWEDAAVDHGSYREGSWKYRLIRMLETRVCRKAGHVAVLCEGLRQDLIGRGIPAQKLSLVGNSIDSSEFCPAQPDEAAARDWNLHGKTVIGFLGSFYRYEGIDLLIEAFALLAGNQPDLRLLLVGGGEMDARLRAKAQALGIEKMVVMPGRIPHQRIPGIYGLFDLLVYPRYSMRLTELVTPLKPLEAMAMGKTVIASDVGGHRELIRDGETGVLFPAGNAQALSSAMEALLLNKERRAALADNGLNWVRRERTWEKTATIYSDIYENIVAKAGRSPADVCRGGGTFTS